MANKRTLYLDPNTWDITLNSSGDISTATNRYADAQNVANATRLFTKDAYLAQTKGIPHFDIDLGVVPSLSEIRSWYRKAAMGVENIQSASIDITSIDDSRTLRGIITATSLNGEITVEF